MTKKLPTLATILAAVIVLDIVTKRWALDALGDGRAIDFLGFVPMRLAFNKGAAFGLSVGEDSRWFFIPVTLVALAFLSVLFRRARQGDHLRILSISLVISGALGNLIDRVRWNRGVVDFIGPVDLGFMHWPIFNVADMAISCGAVLLALSFWLEDRAAATQSLAPATAASEGGAGSGSAPGQQGPAAPPAAPSEL